MAHCFLIMVWSDMTITQMKCQAILKQHEMKQNLGNIKQCHILFMICMFYDYYILCLGISVVITDTQDTKKLLQDVALFLIKLGNY